MNYNIYRIVFDFSESIGIDTKIAFDNKNLTLLGIEDSLYPKCNETTIITVYYLDGINEGSYTFYWRDWIKLSNEGEGAFSTEDTTRLGKIFFDIADLPLPRNDDSSNADTPTMVMEDISELEFFDFPALMLNDASKGIWAYHGIRRLRFTIENCPFDMLEKGVKFKAIGCFVKKDNIKLQTPIEITDIHLVDTKDDNDNFALTACVDTNLFGEEFDFMKQHLQFFGALEVTYFSDQHEVLYNFPMQVKVYNTNYYSDNKIPCPNLVKNKVSIDFGTSSSCVAVKKGSRFELLTISSEKLLDRGEEIYENPTNIMLFDWENLYKQWCTDNKNFPHFKQGSYDEYRDNVKTVEYDAGYTVRDALNGGESDVFNSILTQIKMVCFQLDQGVEMTLFPMIKKDIRVVKLVSSPDGENEESLDPVAFYAYILGRAINNPAREDIYTKFVLTYPVKFNPEVREKLKRSLEYGLKRSLPLPLREAKEKNGKPLFEVKMEYCEPFAYIGAVCGTEHLPAEEGSPALFAVYDFGGGTLDFSFGMFSVNEDDEGVLDLFGIDGDRNVGGETLISRISYWIYSDNISEMTANNIPFVLPEQENFPDDFPERLLCKSSTAKSNVRFIDELISRKLFQDKLDDDKKNSHTQLGDGLRNEANEPVDVELSIDYSILMDKLTNIIEESIKKFELCIQNSFYSNTDKMLALGLEFNMDNVIIFKSGNSSRSVIVEQKMEEYFPNNQVKMVEEGDGKKYSITPKTAVAIGQLNLENFLLPDNSSTPFAWNVYIKKMGGGKFEAAIEKNWKDSDWVYYSVVRNNTIDVHFSDTFLEDINDNYYTLNLEGTSSTEDLTKGYLYLRMHDENSIEYFISEEKKSPDNSLAPNKNCVANLSEHAN